MVETDFLHNYKAIKSRSSVILMEKKKEKSNRPWLKIENGVTLILIRPDSWEFSFVEVEFTTRQMWFWNAEINMLTC